MRPPKTLESLRTGQPSRMAEAARDVGHEFPRRRPDQLNEFRRGLEELVRRTPADSYARGFCDALEHVTAAFLSEATHEEDLSSARRVVETKPRWVKVLRALTEGNVLPADISSASGMPRSSVARTLQELEEASLIDRPAPGAEADGRQRPCVLTSTGAALAHRLLEDTHPRIAAVRDILPVIENFYSSLISQRRVNSYELLKIAQAKIGRELAEYLVEDLFDAARRSALAVREPDVAIAVFDATDLSKVLTTTRGNPREFHSMRAIVSEGVRTYVCSSRWQYLWDQWARMGNLDHVVTLNNADLQYGPPLGAPYQVVYDDPVLANRDVMQELPRRMLDTANRRFCLVPRSDQVLPPSFESVLWKDHVPH